ncbi:MAG: PhzF family phenazine biosynthesis protein [Solirubrobacteraceae bacterium]
MRRYLVLDVFTDVPLEGNPVAVFTDGEGLSDELMQRTARELNLSETVFLLAPDDGAHDGAHGGADEGADARARIFTPATELPFAGHPVLGTAFVLGERLGTPTVRLQTGAGVITIELRRERERIVFGEMAQPIPTWTEFARGEALLHALGVERSGLPIEVYDNGVRHAYVELEDDAGVTAVQPDMAALAALGELGVSCFAGSGGGWKTRVFAAGLGVPEDPATGSAAGPLAVHLARHGRIRFGERIEIRQGVEIGRPSLLHGVADGSPERIQRVAVGGGAVLVAEGGYRLD